LISTVTARPPWLTIAAGSKTYIDKVLKGFPPNHLRLNTTVTGLTNEADGRVRLYSDDGRSEVFDHVILATHGDQAWEIIRDSATAEEQSIMTQFRTSRNVAVLHSDASLMPRSPKAWSSWNYLTKSTASPEGMGNTDKVCVTYNMNKLQHIPREVFGDVMVTLNPHYEPDPKMVQGWYTYRHPLYTAETVHAQQRLEAIQNTRGISYAGAWTKYGFHEDGFSSGLRVAVEHLGAKIPFDFVDSTFSRGQKPKLTALGSVVRLVVTILQIFVVKVLHGLANTTPTATTTRRLASKVTGPVPAAMAGRLHETEN
jgi:predicted NAD/FAD-binding protein